MRFEIRVAQSAERQMLALPAFRRAIIRAALETHLRHEPGKVSKSRIKRMRGLIRPQYRLRVDEFRVFYDIVDQEVQVIAIVSKTEATRWLAEFGQAEP
jgi:mRNA-degrading endonuclease RelE of RelBE toxin-antitoxin system